MSPIYPLIGSLRSRSPCGKGEPQRITSPQTKVGAGWQLPPLLILAAWHDTPAMLKMLRLAEHVEWAGKHDALDSVGTFLRGLREEGLC